MTDEDTRQAKFESLLRRANKSNELNRKAVYDEDKLGKKSELSDRKKALAQVELAKLEAQEAGIDYEKQTAWDWTIEDTEKWNAKQKIKQQNREDSQFSDYSRVAEKAYLRTISKRTPNLDKYNEEKAQLESSISDSSSERQVYISLPGEASAQQPSKESKYRLIDTLSKQQDRPAKRSKTTDEHSDGNYINVKNKNFNQKLGKYMDKYK